MHSDGDELGQGEAHQLTEDRVCHLAHVGPESNLAARSRKSSICSTSTDLSEMEVDAQPTTDVQSAGGPVDRLVVGELESERDEGESERHEDDSDATEDVDQEPTRSTESNQGKKNPTSVDSALASKLAMVELRRSSRKKQSSEVVSQSQQPSTPLPLPKIVVMTKPIVRKDRLVVLVSVGNTVHRHPAQS